MTTKKKPSIGGAIPTDGNTRIESNEQSDYTTTPPALSTTNHFEQVHANRGGLSDRQLFTLDMMRGMSDSDQFNAYREAAGLKWWTPNYTLSKDQASRLIKLIKEGEVGQ